MSGYFDRTSKSREILQRAKKMLPGGITYAIRWIDPYPFYVSRADGCRLYDVDGNVYVDYWCAHFSLILGHRSQVVVEALNEQLERGYHLGVAHENEVKLAEQVSKMTPSVEMVKFSNSGTEANMYAVRLARTYTRCSAIVKFEGNWHGGYDALHTAVRAPLDEAPSGGITKGATSDTIVMPYNDLEATVRGVRGKEIACIIVEPVMGAGGMIPADRDFLKGLRELCNDLGALLIFDEVITGFRLSPAGAQQLYGVQPDLTIFGKIVGGGLPMGAIGGRADVMQHMDHLKYSGRDFSFLGGTGVGNAMSVAAGYATLRKLEKEKPYHEIGRLGDRAREEIRDAFDRKGIPAETTGVGSLFACHFVEGKVRDVRAASAGNRELSERLHLSMLEKGIFYLTPHLFHAAISTAHSAKDIDDLVAAVEAFARVAKH